LYGSQQKRGIHALRLACDDTVDAEDITVVADIRRRHDEGEAMGPERHF
jgi:hypothetical protein